MYVCFKPWSPWKAPWVQRRVAAPAKLRSDAKFLLQGQAQKGSLYRTQPGRSTGEEEEKDDRDFSAFNYIPSPPVKNLG